MEIVGYLYQAPAGSVLPIDPNALAMCYDRRPVVSCHSSHLMACSILGSQTPRAGSIGPPTVQDFLFWLLSSKKDTYNNAHYHILTQKKSNIR